jgi:hypothetical protein
MLWCVQNEYSFQYTIIDHFLVNIAILNFLNFILSHKQYNIMFQIDDK